MTESNGAAAVPVNGRKRVISSRELTVFCQQVHLILHSGMLLGAGIEAMAGDSPQGYIHSLLMELSRSLEGGVSFAAALKEAQVFPAYMVQMVEIGEESGRLDLVMKSLSLHYKQQTEMRESVKSAVLYPCILIVMMLLILIFLAAKVLPIFENVFHSLGGELSAGAASIMGIGSLFDKYAWFFVALAAVAVAVGVFLYATGKGRAMCAQWFAKGKLAQSFSRAAFASSMSMMLASGLDPGQALSLAQGAVNSPAVQDQIRQCRTLLEGGECSFSEALAQCGIFSGTACSLLSTGARSGELDSSMVYIADLYTEEFQRAMMKKVSLIEPISVAVLSIVMGIILISVMFPLLGVMSSIG